jgi:hypothetical protein
LALKRALTIQNIK